jgi:hypothetical protein
MPEIFNPFRASIVNDPWGALETDVPSIHQSTFERCCEAIRAIRSTGNTTSMLIHGEPGSGKTHLLARLRMHIAEEAEADGPGGLQEAVFVSVRLQTTAQMIWRHLRRCFVGDLLRRADDSKSQLERLLLHQLSLCGLVKGDGFLWLKQAREDFPGADRINQALGCLFDEIDPEVKINYKLRQIFSYLLLKRHYSEAAAWLRGDSLPQSALQKLGFENQREDEEKGDDLELDDQDVQIVLALCRLATPDIPFIFCFDQVEALQTHQQDTSGLFAFGQMIADLHDNPGCKLLISSVNSTFLDSLRVILPPHNYARASEFDRPYLPPLSWDESAKLIQVRMNSIPELASLRSEHPDNPLWPLQEAEVKNVFISPRCNPRPLLAHCADLFDVWRKGNAPPPPPAERFLDQAFEERRQQALEESEPSQTDDIISHGLSSLISLAHQDWQVRNQPAKSDVSLAIERANNRISISLCNSNHWPSLVKKLERLNAQLSQGQTGQLVLLRDGRRPIGPGAKKTKVLRDELLKRGARWVEPSVEALVALDALRKLLSDARSGDLANHGATVVEQTVLDWLAENLPPELRNLLDEVLPSVVGPHPDPDDLALYEAVAELLQRHHLISVADAASMLNRANDEIANCAPRHSDRIGALGEPPIVLFRLVSEGSAIQL